MSMRIAVALAATIGASIAMSSAAQARPELVEIDSEYAPGTIVVKTHERKLYLILDYGRAMRYPVGVGKAGRQWTGTTKIDGKYLNPAWSPPSAVRRDKPDMPDVIPGGSPRNPMGVAAMTLGRRRIRYPRHQRAGLGRRFRLLRLHPHAQRRYHRPLSTRLDRHDRDGDALITS